MKLLRKLMDRIQEGWQRKATRRKAITVLACFVVFTTVYALIMPAITLTQKAASAMGGIGLEESAFAGELTAETEENAAFKAFVKVGEGAIPEGTTVEVREILPDSKDYDYKLWYEKAQEAVTEDRGNNFDIRQIHLYTINLLNEGVKVEPEAPLEISFNYEKGLSIFDRSLLTAISLPVNEEGKPKDEKGKLVAPEKIMPDAEDKGTDAESITFNMSDIAMIAVAELKDISAGTLSAEGDDYSVSVQYGKDAKIPAGSVLSVNEIGQDTEEYQEYYAKAAETVSAGSLDFARFFDVTISYDGEELEPAAPVSVQISYDNPLEVSEEQEVQAIHFAAENGEETPELLNIRDKISETQGSVEKVTDITFEQESFSVIGTVLTNSSNIWEERKNWTNCAMIVTPDDKNFYAVKYDGSIVEVTMSEDKSAVTFAPFSTGETDEDTLTTVQSDYLWNLNYGNANNVTLFARQIKTTHSDFNNQIQPFNESAISNANSAWYIVRDSVGHLYHYYYHNGYTRWYLGVDTSESKITGEHGYSNTTPNSISENYCKVYFAKDINIRASAESAAWPASNNKQYMILTADKQTYYAAAKDGSLTPVTIVYTDGTYKILFTGDCTSGYTSRTLENQGFSGFAEAQFC